MTDIYGLQEQWTVGVTTVIGKNPRRVPPFLTAVDPSAPVGRLPTGHEETSVMVIHSDSSIVLATAPETAIYLDADGNPVQITAGSVIPEGHTLRSEDAAPENRADPITPETPEARAVAPENRKRAEGKV